MEVVKLPLITKSFTVQGSKKLAFTSYSGELFRLFSYLTLVEGFLKICAGHVISVVSVSD